MCGSQLITASYFTVINFFTLLTSLVVIFYNEDIDPLEKPINVPQEVLKKEYDFIIVGAGSAGAVLASRLTEVEKWSVLLIEAGGDEDAETDTPAISSFLCNFPYNWNYTTVEQKYMCRDVNGKCAYPRGRVMGGSSTLNDLLYVRGNSEDFNEWASLGNKGWAYDDVLKYFIKMENVSFYPALLNWTDEDKSIRGTTGPQTVQYQLYPIPPMERFLTAAQDMGYVVGDFNGVNQSRVNYAQLTINGPSRASTSKSYLNPIRRRKNLHVIKLTFVTKLHIDQSGRVQLVEYVRDGRYHHVKPRKEVILSAGAVNTPKILMLSGIGPSSDLQTLKIPVIRDLPVGKNFQDHPLAYYTVSTSLPGQVTLDNLLSFQSALEYAKYRKGPLTSANVQIMAFTQLWGARVANAQWAAGALPSPERNQKFFLASTVLTPESRGTIRLNSSNPFIPPLIDPNFLAEDEDRKLMTSITREIVEMIRIDSLKEINATIEATDNPSCASYIGNIDEFVACLIERQSFVYYHACCSARMGPSSDLNSVVDNQLMVHGMKNLRVVDASVMPSVTRGNTNAPTIMIGEKAADIIKLQYDELPMT